jgi:uncharacterized protein
MRSDHQSRPSRQTPKTGFALPGIFGLLTLGAVLFVFALTEAQLLPLRGQGFRQVCLLGGGLLLLSGVAELRRKNGFGATTFLGFGFFWLSLSAFFYGPHRIDNPVESTLFASYVIMWAMFSCILFLGTLRQGYLLQTTFALMAVYLLTFGAAFLSNQPGWLLVTGYLGAGCGVLLWVLGLGRLKSKRWLRQPQMAGIAVPAKKA